MPVRLATSVSKARGGNRTLDLALTRRVLFLLSYPSAEHRAGLAPTSPVYKTGASLPMLTVQDHIAGYDPAASGLEDRRSAE